MTGPGSGRMKIISIQISVEPWSSWLLSENSRNQKWDTAVLFVPIEKSRPLSESPAISQIRREKSCAQDWNWLNWRSLARCLPWKSGILLHISQADQWKIMNWNRIFGSSGYKKLKGKIITGRIKPAEIDDHCVTAWYNLLCSFWI